MRTTLLAALFLVACGAENKRRDAGIDAEMHPGDDARDGDAASDIGPLDASDDAAFDAARTCAPLPLPASVARVPGGVLAMFPSHSVELVVGSGIVRVRRVAIGATAHASYGVTDEPEPVAVEVGARDDGTIVVCAGSLVVTLDSRGAVAVRDGETLYFEDVEPLSLNASGLRVAHRARTDERFYGFGERSGAMDRRGRILTFWNTDAYDPEHGGYAPGADPLYQSIPFYVALDHGRAHGVFVDDSRRVTMDVASSSDVVGIDVLGARVLDEYVITGPAIADVVTRYASLTGTTPMPPRWALGYHQSRWGYESAARLIEIATELRARHIPADAMWLDIQHMDGFRTFTWDEAQFADPEAMLAELDALGFRVVVIADPGLKVDPEWSVYRDAEEAGLFLEDEEGSYVGSVWPGPSSFLDFTHPEARAFWGTQVEALIRRGVDGVWLDVNEPTTFPEGGDGASVPNELAVFGDGEPATMAEAHNVYGLLEARATREGIARTGVEPFILSRAGYAGIQRYAAVWTGDAPSTWASLRDTMPMLLGLSLSGVPFVGSDVGGYSGHASPELYARWVALGSLSPFFRGHVTSGVPGQEPWAFGADVEAIARRHIETRYALLPYLESLFDEAQRTGAPVLRPMIYEAQTDPTFEQVDDQAMLGPFLLVAPVLVSGATTRSVRLPEGRFFELRSAAMFEGPGLIDVPAPLAELPVFVREGAIVPRQATTTSERSPITIDLYPPSGVTRFVVYDQQRMTLELARTADGATLSVVEGGLERPIAVRMRRVDRAPIAIEIDGTPSAAPWDSADLSVTVALPPSFTSVRFRYDPRIDDPSPLVDVPIEVTVPEHTPDPIHIATSASGWAHAPLEWVSERVARGVVRVPRGSWFEYKFTRGGWGTVEKNEDCSERSNRTARGDSSVVHDIVARFADGC